MNEPVNYQGRDLGYIDQDLVYAKETYKKFNEAIQRCGANREKLRFLEIGPGTDFGAQLLLASTGVEVTLADRYLAKWNPDFHPLMYRRLYDSWDGPKSELEKALRSGGYEDTRLVLTEQPAEEMTSLADASFDLVYSNAVLEHVTDIGKVAREISRVVKADGFGYHQIDWRNHRNFDRPLDHLVIKENAFFNIAEESFWEIGNRFRSIEFWLQFEAVGFRIIERIVNGWASPDYLAEITPQLRRSPSSYRFWPGRDLDKVSGALVMRKTSGLEEAMLRERAEDTLALIDAVKVGSLAASSAEAKLMWQNRSADVLEIEIDPDLLNQDGFMWSVVSDRLPIGDTVDDPFSACTQFYEDGDALGPSHAVHEQIRSLGRGRFSHWKNAVMFSTSDNSSPKENGRTYTIRIPGPAN